VWESDDARPRIPPDLVAEPAMAGAERERRRERWAEARAVSEARPAR